MPRVPVAKNPEDRRRKGAFERFVEGLVEKAGTELGEVGPAGSAERVGRVVGEWMIDPYMRFAGLFDRAMRGEEINPLEVTEAVTEVGMMSTVVGRAPAGSLGMFVRTTPFQKRMAKEMIDQGMDPEDVWREVMAFKGPEGKWRTEIPDNKMWVSRVDSEPLWGGAEPLVKNRVKHEELFKRVPEVGDIRLETADLGQWGGEYSSAQNKIRIDKDIHRGIRSRKELVAHELMHGVQQEQGLASGAHPLHYEPHWRPEAEIKQMQGSFDMLLDAKWLRKLMDEEQLSIVKAKDKFVRTTGREPHDQAGSIARFSELKEIDSNLERYITAFDATRKGYDKYLNTAGEIEARDVPGRMDMDWGELAANPPTLLRRRDDPSVIVREGGSGSSSMAPISKTDTPEFRLRGQVSPGVPKTDKDEKKKVHKFKKSFL